MSDDDIEARDGLLARDLIAFDGSRFQVLSLPPKPAYQASHALRASQDLEDHDPATVRRTLLASLVQVGERTPR
jgi:hypothetical protein